MVLNKKKSQINQIHENVHINSMKFSQKNRSHNFMNSLILDWNF